MTASKTSQDPATFPSTAFSVSAAAAEDGERLALLDGEQAWSYARLAEGVAGVAEWLRHRFGDRSPKRVAIVGERRLESLLAAYAVLELGWTLVPLHARWSQGEKKRLLSSLGISSWLDLSEMPPDEQVPLTATAAAEPIPPRRLLAIVPTSGSSGEPKGVALSYGAFHASARASAARLGWQTDDRWLLSLPLAHVGGLSILTRCLEARRTVVLPPEGERFDAENVFERIEKSRITHLSVVPAMLRRLLDAAPSPPTSLRRMLVGGAPLPPAWLDEARRAGWPALATYGLTEACSQVATQPPEDLESKPRSGAPLLDDFEARLDPHGVLYLRGPALFSGYLPTAPAGSAAPAGAGHSAGHSGSAAAGLDEDGWLRTGDVAKIEDGRLHILGRHDQVIITGGENVHPAEVERALLELPGVDAACVVGVADETWGQSVVAAAAPKSLDPETLEAALQERLARFKHPRRWLLLDALPTTASGKVDRAAVSRLFT